LSDFKVIHSKSKLFYDRYERKPELQHQTHYCPGCGHGVAHKLIAETLADLGLQENTIFVSPVGCSVFAYYYFDVGNVQVAHGRAPAAATALKRACPDKTVISYQGDGDLAAIGTAEIIHAANRGENISVFFINNAIYGMTGGQMAPTTLLGQYATTAPWGRRPNNEGFPLHVAELISSLEAPVYVERVALHDPKNVMKARKAVRKALELQKAGAGFTLVEILSPCPTIWKMDPLESRKWIAEKMLPVFPLNVFRDRKAEFKPVLVPRRPPAEVLGIEEGEAIVETGHRRSRSAAIKIAGFGGQGVLLLGQILAEMGMREDLEVSWLPSYGPEMRSGSAHCHVNLSTERIGSPLISHPDVLVAMNELSLRKFGPEVAPGGLIFYNRDKAPSDFVAPQARLICIPASEMADTIGTAKVANIVLLGALLAETETLTPESAVAVLEKKVKKAKILELDLQALRQGQEFVQQQVEVGAVGQPDGCGY